jgi:CheY-like chemotaxis protein
MNLVSNAVEAMPDGGDILISTTNRQVTEPVPGNNHMQKGEYVVLAVSDSGVGIADDEKDRIFEPFYTKKKMGKSGTGLGMAVVWGTVQDHSGYIDIESTVGIGTTFTIFIPATREKVATENSKFFIEKYRGNGENILVVDDLESQRDIATDILTKLGYLVFSVSSGLQAIEFVKKQEVDLIIIDMLMEPGIDGLETYQRILSLYPTQKAIIASGYSETYRVRESLRLGAGAYIRKPYSLETIGVVVSNELKR